VPSLLERHEIDDARWNATVNASATPLPYACTWYLDAVAPGWQALVDAEYQRVMPLTVGKKLGLEYLYQPYFTQQLGIFSQRGVDDETVRLFLDDVKRRFSFVQIQWHYGHDPVAQPDFEFTPRRTCHLSLDRPYDVVQAGYNASLRRNVRKATAKKLTVATGESSRWLIDTFRNAKGSEVNELGNNDYARLETLIAAAVANHGGCVYAVFNGDKQVASSFVLQSRRYVIPVFSISNAAGRAVDAMSFLFDSVIRDSCGNDMIFDFEGSQIPSINAFNLSFGAAPVTYWMLYRNALPWHARLLKNLKDAL